ncbi:MAG: hypothetical protein ACFCUM_17700 [Bacteroidales bacterium]
MRKQIGRFTAIVLLLAITLNGCEKDIDEKILAQATANTEKDFNAVAKVASPDDIKALLSSTEGMLTTRSATSGGVSFGDNFVSMMDIHSYDEFNNSVTYYDVLEFSDLVPNEDLATLLNTKGEIQVGNLMYRITPAGTYYYDPSLREDVDAIIEQLDEMKGQQIGEYTFKLAEGITRYNTFEEAAEEIVVEDKDFYANDPYWDDAYFDMIENSGGAGETRALGTIPGVNNFPRYSAASQTIVGGWLEDLFGRNKAYYVDISSKRRLKGKLYYYKYHFYDEFGLMAETQKKNWIGWSGTNADEMAIGWRSTIVELELPFPNPPTLPTQQNLYGGSYTGIIPGTDQTGKVSMVLGIDIDNQYFQSAIKAGGTATINWKKTLSGGNTTEVNGTDALFVVAKNAKVYVVIVDSDIRQYNVEKIRKVFASDFHFQISLNIASLPTAWKGWLGTVSGGQKFPAYTLKQSECVVAARMGTVWRGLALYKD